MPVNTYLNWADITDFTPGLWDQIGASQLIAPQNALVECTDYQPLPGGGLRAFYAGTPIVTTGITSPSTKSAMGIWVRGAVPLRTGSGNGSDFLLAVIDSISFKAQLYRMDGSNSETTWKSEYQDASGASSAANEAVEFALFQTTAGAIYYLFMLRGGSAQGLYQLAYVGGTGPPAGDGVVTKLQTWHGPLLVAQARVLSGNGEVIQYSDVGAVSFTSTSVQQLIVAPNEPNAVVALLSETEPSDLIVGLQGAPWYEINGDISDVATPVRAMGDNHHQRVHFQHPCRVPGGIAFIEPGGRIFVTDGRTFQSISDPIVRFDTDIGANDGPGQLAFLNDYLFAPSGHVYDFTTKAWFQSSLVPDSAYHYADSGNLYMVNANVGIAMGSLNVFEGSSPTAFRASSGVIQTVPYADKSGRNVRIREVQVYVNNYVPSSMSVSIIDGKGNIASTDSVSGSAVGRKMLQFLFPNVEDDYLSVRITPSADNGTSEAPTIERVRIGFGPNNLVGNVAE